MQPVSTTGQTSSDPANLMSLLGGGGGGGGGVTGGGMGGLESLLGGLSNSLPSTSTSIPSPATSLAPPVPGEIPYRSYSTGYNTFSRRRAVHQRPVYSISLLTFNTVFEPFIV